ncbi:16S rRNA (cytidine(1402)-2'-O)-methyltransferase [Wenzhouxiangella sp. XN79A]|uniref:16S rRNA (cytidine(1402)-2'-O)-methyltransferase n=1 Tax=Wenzhouxiangella sp. XN79A TaxID=2724193 RepID=UPI00197FE572|nr:16S rRNA (cytidine(1402)-2'-O)-methyltransferase [Wenzhouxiangella sp. XN79A]
MPASDAPDSTGTLYVIATPIGHLGDLSPRAAELLGRVPVIAAEDTRTSQKLVPSRAIPPHWIALHDHNEARAAERVLDHLRAGDDVALVSDAGTPLVSDPGYRLVDGAHAAGLAVLPVPGPCAAIAALSASGLASDRFAFEGFLPAKAGARRKRLAALAEAPHTLIFYVPARDLVGVLGDLAEAFGAERPGCVARELTKRFEQVRRDGLAALAEWTAADPDRQRGEAVVLVAGAPGTDGATASKVTASALADALAGELPPARAARVIRALTGLPRADAFALVEARRERES